MRRQQATPDPLAHLPDDPEMAAMDAERREQLGRHWAGRAASELRVACVFAVVARGLFESGADREVLRIAGRAVSDEVRHAEICLGLARRYQGRGVDWPAPEPARMPQLAGAPRAIRATLHVVAMGCLNETIASAWLEASLRETTSSVARAAIRELIADDIHHARMGWAHVASSFVGREMRRELGSWLPRLLEAASWKWTRDGASAIGEGCPAHGMPSNATTHDVVRDTLRSVILPGFDELGVPTAAAREWWMRQYQG